MNHNDGWMNGWNGTHEWAGGATWIWPAVGILAIFLLVVAISKFPKK